MKPWGPLAVAAIAALAGPARADADSLNDPLGPREIAMGESMRADARGGQATILNPAGLSLSSELVFEGAYGHRPGDGAHVVNLAACDSTVPVPGCFYYRYIGAEPSIGDMSFRRRVHEGGIVVSRPISPQIILGTTTRYFDYDSDLMDEEDASGFGVDVGLLVRPTEMINLAGVGYNLIGADSAQYPRALAAGLALRPTPLITLGVDGLWKLERDEGEAVGRYGGGAEYFFQSGDMQTAYPLRAGVVYDAEWGTYVTGGLGLQTARLGIDVGARKQVSGGDELMIQANLRIFGPRQEAGSGMGQGF